MLWKSLLLLPVVDYIFTALFLRPLELQCWLLWPPLLIGEIAECASDFSSWNQIYGFCRLQFWQLYNAYALTRLSFKYMFVDWQVNLRCLRIRLFAPRSICVFCYCCRSRRSRCYSLLCSAETFSRRFLSYTTRWRADRPNQRTNDLDFTSRFKLQSALYELLNVICRKNDFELFTGWSILRIFALALSRVA